jgi:L-alanine-DL-glutamate epimerase-like enolase superfamily enzyme
VTMPRARPVGAVSLSLEARSWPMHEPFAIARGVQTHQDALIVTLVDASGAAGRGEGCGVPYVGETPATMSAQIEAVRSEIEAGVDRFTLLELLPPGGARCAVDAALWDLAAKQTRVSAFDAAGTGVGPVVTAFTIGMRDLTGYEAAARAAADLPLLKVKVGKGDPRPALEAVLRGSPRAQLIVDPNQAWSPDELAKWAPHLAGFAVVLLEQPIPVGAESYLDGVARPVPLAADELINTTRDLDRAVGRFDVINIKLDKTGGLTAALALADEAHARGFKLMVGCMAGSSLSMAPAMALAQRCAFVDLDGPLLQSEDWPNPIRYERGVMQPPSPALWG